MSPMRMCDTMDAPMPTPGFCDSKENEMSIGRSGRTCRTCSGADGTAELALEIAGAGAGDRSVPPEAGGLGPGVSCIRASMASLSIILELSPVLHKGKRRAETG